MRRRNGGVDRIDRGRYVRQLLHAARQAGLAAVLVLSVGALPSAGAAAGPPRPGDPPDKQTAGITVPPDDPAITAGATEYPGITGPLLGYLAAPKGGDVYPGILVIHDRQGLNEHFKDIVRRLAKAGYRRRPRLARAAADPGGPECLGALSRIPPGGRQDPHRGRRLRAGRQRPLARPDLESGHQSRGGDLGRRALAARGVEPDGRRPDDLRRERSAR
ncbi:MAG: hypothetical protein E6H03_03335 [Bacillati bacterium ANGP1]|uniref:Dienelactone hydrolase domain-containing protein n=1 Tax=Candidatus Segetimicrobium genomatis TaxID=2569760 RepID=A0A537JJC7_9BACT|nr:MAG: hypothetical protein E6H03_03335 [Terrabacteria group bacterium ANGP1]